jgi:uncharacterized membrane protein
MAHDTVMTTAAGALHPRRRVRLDVALVVLAATLAVLGVAIASYLAFENIQSESGVCTITHGCATVQQSKYGKLFGVPVSVPGLALYATLFTAALLWLTNFRSLRSTIAPLAFFASLFGLTFSGYLTYIEGWVLDAWCIYCIASASLMGLLTLTWLTITLRTSRTQPPPSPNRPSQPEHVRS